MKELENKYSNILSKMIEKETISEDNNFNKEKFDAFHDLLKELFPGVFSTFKYEEFNGSILLSWIVNEKDPILLMSHHDVVDANGKWIHDPFKPVIENGKLYGRGTLDTKGNLFAILQAIEEIIAEGYIPTRSIYIESACNEETSGEGAQEISKELQERNVHFLFTLDEGGMILENPIGISPGKYAMIAVGEKGVHDVIFSATATGGHASTPPKNTPLIRLSKFMLEIENKNKFPKYLNDTNIEMFKRMSKNMKGILKPIFKHAKFNRFILTKLLPKFSNTGKALIQTTVCFTKASGSNGFNVIPSNAWVSGNIRIAHHEGYEHTMKYLSKVARKYDITLTDVDNCITSKICDFNNNEFKFLEYCIKSCFANTTPSPYIANGASDSRFFDKLSDNIFRFAPFEISDEQLESIHGLDENVDVKTLPQAVNFYKFLIKELN